MDFNFTEDQQAIRETIRKFAEKEVAPRAEELDRTGEFPYDLVKRCGDIGLIGLAFPEDIGGSNGDTISWSLGLEEISRADMSLGVTIFVSVVNGLLLYENGTKELVRKFVPPLIRGETVGAFGLTEPAGGSDNKAILTTALEKEDKVILNGSKCFITNAGTDISSFVNVIAALAPISEMSKKFCIVVVPNGTPGYTISNKYRKMGWHSSDTRELAFDECVVPAENMIVEPGKGLSQALTMLSLGRIAMAACSIGVGQACLDASLKYSKERVAFGRSISKFGRVQDMLVEMAVEIEAARLLTYKAAFLWDQSRNIEKEISIAKLYATEAGKKAADLAVQIHGGYGYIDEYPVSRYYRDIRIATIGDGTSEIHRMLIARHLGCLD